jgi:bifunctional DNA-binding transcriptional regulator/antitoxin component of YhaV-PrlF toxin-antitoxin module
MSGDLRVQVAQRGVITLPKQLRESNKVKTGDVYSIIDLGDGVFMLRPQVSRVDELADSIGDALRAKGETLESMLMALRAAREKHGRRKAKTLS